MRTRSYRDLLVWQRAMDLVTVVHRITYGLPRHEQFGLASQMRRAAVSVPSNIAEGNGRLHRGEYIHHISIARGSLLELETHLELVRRLSYAQSNELVEVGELVDHVGRMLQRLGVALRKGGRHTHPTSPVPRP